MSTAQTAAEREPKLRIGGVTGFSTTDYPGQLAAVVFCQGCPWRCAYCHNPHLLSGRTPSRHTWHWIRELLARRIGLLDAVVFSGGEPLAQRDLPDAMRQVKRLGYRIGLHTGGAYPSRLAETLPLIDWVGFDVKTDFADYARITTAAGSGDEARRSLRLVIESGVAHEFRTTVHPHLHDPSAIERLASELAALGVRRYAVQAFRAVGCADKALCANGASTFLTTPWCDRIAARFESFAVRGAEPS